MRVEEFTGRAKKALPYVFTGLLGTNLGEAIRMTTGSDASEKILSLCRPFRRPSVTSCRLSIRLI